MTSFYGTDNPYRAPTVARDVATFRGAFQEVARIEPPKADVLDFFYEGVKSFEHIFKKTKEAYENNANELIAGIEDQKAKDILSGMSQEDVNRKYSESYTALADSGQINKNLNAYKTLTKNAVAARGAVVGDVATDAWNSYQSEMAEAGHSYVDQQRISEKYLGRYKGTQVGDILEQKIRPLLSRAQKAQSIAEVTRATDNVLFSAQLNIAEATSDPDTRSEFLRNVFDPSQGGVPPLLDDDNQVTLESQNHLSNTLFDAQIAPLLEDVDPSVREVVSIELKNKMAEEAQQILLKHKNDVLIAEKAEENRETLAGFVTTLSRGGQGFDDLSLSEAEGVASLSKQEFFAASFSSAAKAVIDDDKNTAEFLEKAWGTGREPSFFKEAVASAIATDNPTESLSNLAKSFPTTVKQAQELGYLPKGEDLDPEVGKNILASVRQRVGGYLMQTGAGAAVNQIKDIMTLNPEDAFRAMPQVKAQLEELGKSVGVDPSTLTAFGEVDTPAKDAYRNALIDIKNTIDGVSGRGSGGMSSDQERLGQLGAIGLDPLSRAAHKNYLDSTKKPGKEGPAIDDNTVGGMVGDRLSSSIGSTGDYFSDAMQLQSSLYSLNDDIAMGRSPNSPPTNRAFDKTMTLIDEIALDERSTKYPEAANGAIHGSLLSEMSSTFPNRRAVSETDKLSMSFRERVGEGSTPVESREWISSPENQQYAHALYSRVESELEHQGLTGKELRASVQRTISSYVGIDGYLKIAKGHLYGKTLGSREEGVLVVTDGMQQGALNSDRLQEQLNVEREVKRVFGADSAGFLDAILGVYTKDDPIDSANEIEILIGDETHKLLANSSYFSRDTLFEASAVANWGADDAELESLYNKFSGAMQNDPVAKAEFSLIMERNLIDSNFTSDLRNGKPEAIAGHYVSSFGKSMSEFMEDRGVINGEFVSFEEGGLDRETHAYLNSSDGIPGDADVSTYQGKSVLFGDLDDWAFESGLKDQDSYFGSDRLTSELETLEIDGRDIFVGKNVAIANQMLRNAKIDLGDGRGEVSLVDGLMRTSDGDFDLEYVNEYVGRLEDLLDSGEANSLQTNLQAMIAASGDKLKGDQALLALESTDDLAMYLASTGDQEPRLISDDNSPSGYSLMIPGMRPLPWAAPKSNFRRLQEGRRWPKPAFFEEREFEEALELAPVVKPGASGVLY